MRNRWGAVLAVCLALASPGLAVAAQACVCARFSSAAEQLARSDAVFRARVLKIERLGDGRAVTTFAVAEALKGRLPRQVRVTHPVLGAPSCGITFRSGEIVTLAADRAEDGSWSTGSCHLLQYRWDDFRRAVRARSAASW